MWQDVLDLRDFYDSPLGQVAQRQIRRQLRKLWTELRGQRVLGLGFTPPYLRAFAQEAERVVALMPAPMGVMHWPSEGRNLSIIGSETELPFSDLSFDRILLAHTFEASEHLQPLLREIWRVMADGGRLMVIAPNRRSIWARGEHTPFGHGQPYSVRQLKRVLRHAMFTPLRTGRALYVPPTNWRFVLAAAPAFERLGERWFQPLAGVTLVEAGKQLFAAVAEREPAQQRRASPVRAVIQGARSLKPD
ncbi:MAG: methyltransferase domain-containing protein [Alphaproteobacteria bacterium]|nr:methyltransferase domain-containing protein [Alphaproteobacteria bacterium]